MILHLNNFRHNRLIIPPRFQKKYLHLALRQNAGVVAQIFECFGNFYHCLGITEKGLEFLLADFGTLEELVGDEEVDLGGEVFDGVVVSEDFFERFTLLFGLVDVGFENFKAVGVRFIK